MTIHVRLFAILKERSGAERLALELPDSATIADASKTIAEKFPVLRIHLARAAFAVNREYAQQSHVLQDGDELAIIPPVSGGVSS